MLSRLTLVFAVLGAAAVRADDSFTKSLTPADFQAAGLGKLSPEELARLDELVRARQSGAVAVAKQETTKAVAAAVREETTKAVTEQVRQQVQAEDRKAAQKQAAPGGFLDRMKVLLKPGTEIEYTTLDSTLATPYVGWRKGTVFTLTNGQRWVVTEDARDWGPAPGKTVHVRIIPGSMGSFFMEIEGSGRPRVKFLGLTAAAQAEQAAKSQAPQ